MIRWIPAFATTFLCAGIMTAAQAQNPTATPQTPQTPRTPTTQAPRETPNPAATIAMTGCLYREADVPGRTPNVAERAAGELQDFILADAKVGAGTAGLGAAATMYKIDGIDDEKLRPLAGKRVEVTGRIDAGDRREAASPAAQPNRNPASPDAINLPEFEAASIRETTGAACPARPAAVPVAPAR